MSEASGAPSETAERNRRSLTRGTLRALTTNPPPPPLSSLHCPSELKSLLHSKERRILKQKSPNSKQLSQCFRVLEFLCVINS